MISNGEIGELIKTLREDSNLKQDNLAKAIGVSKAAVSQWENGKGIKTENIYLISKLFNFSITYHFLLPPMDANILFLYHLKSMYLVFHIVL